MVSTDIGNSCSVSNGYISFNQPRSFLAAMTFGNCGYAFPAAMGAKVAMRAVGGESRMVVIAAHLDGIGHPRVPHSARFTFRQIDKNLCPVIFIPYETKWRSDLKAQPGRRYRRAIAGLAETIDNVRNSAAGVQSQQATPAKNKGRKARTKKGS